MNAAPDSLTVAALSVYGAAGAVHLFKPSAAQAAPSNTENSMAQKRRSRQEVLDLVEKHSPGTVVEIAAKTGLASSVVSRALKKLGAKATAPPPAAGPRGPARVAKKRKPSKRSEGRHLVSARTKKRPANGLFDHEVKLALLDHLADTASPIAAHVLREIRKDLE